MFIVLGRDRPADSPFIECVWSCHSESAWGIRFSVMFSSACTSGLSCGAGWRCDGRRCLRV
jgi:hypothetical protein